MHTHTHNRQGLVLRENFIIQRSMTASFCPPATFTQGLDLPSLSPHFQRSLGFLSPVSALSCAREALGNPSTFTTKNYVCGGERL